MCTTKPIYEFHITEDRIQKALSVIASLTRGRADRPAKRAITVLPANDAEANLVTTALDGRGIRYVDASTPALEAEPPIDIETVLEVFHELGWPDQVVYAPTQPQPDERLQLFLTDLQFVALAASLAAVHENQARRRLS